MKNYLNKKFCTAATLLIAVFGFSQNVIKVNSSNSKTSIYTLKKGEELDTQEAEITFSGNGTNYEFVTELNDKYYLHSNKFHVGPYNRTPRKIGKGIYILENIEWNDFKLVRDEEYILDIKTGKKSGPYQNITTFYNYNEGDENQDGALDGDEQLFSSLLSYESKGKTFLRNLKTNSTLGPYDSVLAFAPQKSSIDFVYKNAGNFYVSLSGKINGPFMKFNQVYSQYKYFWILTDQSGKANVVVNHEMIGTINNLNEMNSYRINNFYGAYSTLFISEKNGIYPGYFYLSNGQKVPGDNSESELSYVFETTNKGWVKLEATDAIRKNIKFTKKIEPAENAWYLYFSDGTSFGPFQITNLQESILYRDKKYFFLVKDMPKKYNAYNSNSATAGLYVICDGKKLIQLPVTNKKNKAELSVSDKNWALLYDGKVYLNGKDINLKNAVSFNFTCNYNSWYALEQPDDVDSSYVVLDGKRVRAFGDDRVKLHQLNMVTDKIFCYSFEVNGWHYERLSNQSEDFGPYENNYGGITYPIIWLNKRHVAFVQDYTKIIINGKDKGNGTALTGNELTGTYHWMSADTKNIYLHNFQP